MSRHTWKILKNNVIVPIDKAANNCAFICKKYYVSKLLLELDTSDLEERKIYEISDHTREEVVNENIKLCGNVNLNISENEKTLPIMYWIPKMHKNPIGARFIVASKTCSIKPITKVISRIFKMFFSQIENFHHKSKFYSNFKKFRMVQNSFPIIEKLNCIDKRKQAKCISTFNFSTLYTTIPHDLLVEVLSEMIDFVFRSSCRNRIGFSTSSIYWTSKGKDKRFFTKESLKNTVSYVIKNCYFTVGNLMYKQKIGIPMGIDPAPFWANLFLYYYEEKYVQKLIVSDSTTAYKYHGIGRFIDDLCALNDGEDFAKNYKEIYPKELDLKLEHEGNHATFLDLEINIVDGVFVYKLFDKRDQFSFFIVRMPHLSSNIPSYIFYGTIFSEILRIARCTLQLDHFIIKAHELYNRMKSQGALNKMFERQVLKACRRYPETFQRYNVEPNELYNSIVSFNT